MLFVGSRETGTIIIPAADLNEARKIIQEWEKQDSDDECYTPNFYAIYNEDHMIIE